MSNNNVEYRIFTLKNYKFVYDYIDNLIKDNKKFETNKPKHLDIFSITK